MSDRVTPPLPGAPADRVLVADGAMGTTLRPADLTLDDFAGHDGRPEIPNVTRPDVVHQVRRGSLEAGADAVETDTFGADLANPAGTESPRRSSSCHVGVPNSHVIEADEDAGCRGATAEHVGPRSWRCSNQPRAVAKYSNS
ncbi:homocysteine S-methyltransferase [Saccharothrix carnea]|uniref:Homocysteine S-methyltransferase n=1 Tax=Saccharothrix carnea TaxID=1280637 RepID=A0A2P8I267_SACCR|nr:homocysteine S-methyltransferase [Saccharothrix carnea]